MMLKKYRNVTIITPNSNWCVYVCSILICLLIYANAISIADDCCCTLCNEAA